MSLLRMFYVTEEKRSGSSWMGSLRTFKIPFVNFRDFHHLSSLCFVLDAANVVRVDRHWRKTNRLSGNQIQMHLSAGTENKNPKTNKPLFHKARGSLFIRESETLTARWNHALVF